MKIVLTIIGLLILMLVIPASSLSVDGSLKVSGSDLILFDDQFIGPNFELRNFVWGEGEVGGYRDFVLEDSNLDFDQVICSTDGSFNITQDLVHHVRTVESINSQKACVVNGFANSSQNIVVRENSDSANLEAAATVDRINATNTIGANSMYDSCHEIAMFAQGNKLIANITLASCFNITNPVMGHASLAAVSNASNAEFFASDHTPDVLLVRKITWEGSELYANVTFTSDNMTRITEILIDNLPG